MRYWLLVILMNVLFWLIVKHVAPEWYGSPGYYAGQIISSLHVAPSHRSFPFIAPALDLFLAEKIHAYSVT